MNPKEIKRVVEWLDSCKQDLLKTWQYLQIFLAWFYERSDNTDRFDHHFQIYLKIFHSRKLFRLFRTVFYLPKIMNLSKQLKSKLQFSKLFELISKIFMAIFYVLDNFTIIAMKLELPYYKVIRRISYSLLFMGIFFSIISIFIDLRYSFKKQSDLKSQLQNLTPTQLLQILAQIDNERKLITIKLIKGFGHLFPTLARTNLPQIIVKTKINKGTVGFFGMISAISGLYLKTNTTNYWLQY